eukprot:GHRR01018485.1.p1 GENE.GHRR01018485.1~~GHRR01018485.1.p1  ORF type:complete len:825 (+),score=308.84 GHRR01018485.1:604-3078(+)
MIKGSLLTWLQRDCTVEQPALPPFLRNKLAQAIVAIVKREYPRVWPNFFIELVAAAGTGPGLADMFVRIMVAVDEDVISLDIPRSAGETKLSMHLKDSMREQGITEVAGAWYNLTQLYKSSRPELAAFVLGSCARYVHWIDIGLVANDKFIPLLSQLMDWQHSSLRAAATDVLIEVVSKRMEPTAKINLVQQLNVVDAMERLSSNLVAAAGANKAAAAAGPCMKANASAAGTAAAANAQALHDDEELLGKYAKLLATLAGEVMDALKRVENVIISFTVAGLGVDDEAGRDAGAAAQTANRLLDSLTRAVLTAFCSGLDTISMPLVPFISAYVARLRALVKRGQQLPAAAQMHLQAVLQGVAAATRYPDNGANEADDGSEGPGLGSSSTTASSSTIGVTANGSGRLSDADLVAAREEQYEVEERRKELLVLLKNAAKLAFREALNFVAGKLQAVLAADGSSGNGLSNGSATAAGAVAGALKANGIAGSVPFQDSELAVTLVYELGEGAPEEALKPSSGTLVQLVLLLLAQAESLPAGRHRLVALAMLETCVRYCRVLQQEQSAIPAVVSLFLGPKGLGHPAADVATRACYLLSRLVKTLRANLKPYMNEVLQQLQPYLVIVATQPPPAGTAAVGTGREVASKALAPITALVDDRLYVFEAVGLLLGQEELPAEQQHAALSSLLQPLMQQIKANLQPAAAEAAGGLGNGSWAILQAIEAIARLSKGFKWELCTRSRPQLGKGCAATEWLWVGCNSTVSACNCGCLFMAAWSTLATAAWLPLTDCCITAVFAVLALLVKQGLPMPSCFLWQPNYLGKGLTIFTVKHS